MPKRIPLGATDPVANLTHYAAGELFAQRALEAKPDFAGEGKVEYDEADLFHSEVINLRYVSPCDMLAARSAVCVMKGKWLGRAMLARNTSHRTSIAAEVTGSRGF